MGIEQEKMPMRPEDVLYWIQAMPFVPFRMTMNSGLTFEVRHPELIRLMRTSLIYFTPSDHEGVYDRAQMYGLVLIESIEPLASASSSVDHAGA
jgi:hypothetical protein